MAALNTIHDLNVLRLEDQAIYLDHAHQSSCPVTSWWTHFPYYWGYSLTGRRKSLWAIVDGLFVPFIFSGKYLAILFMPFGKGTPAAYLEVLRKSLNLCAQVNRSQQHYTYVKWVTEDQVQFLRQTPGFDHLFYPQEIPQGPEFHYSVQALLTLEGKEFARLRLKKNRLEKNYPDIVFREYIPADYQQMILLNEKWLADAQNRYTGIFDSAYYPAFLKHHDQFGHITLVAEKNGTIIGMVSGAVTPNGQSYCFLRKALREYVGLSETLVIRLAQAIHAQDQNVEFLNDGGAGGKHGMTVFKSQLRPRVVMNRYRLFMNSLLILKQTAYRGASVVSYSPSARLVVDGGQTDMFRNLSDEHLQRLNSLITNALGRDAADLKWQLAKCPALIIAQVAIILQQAARHPVTAYGAREIAPGKAELSFDLLRPKLLSPLIECIRAFWQSGLLGLSENLFGDRYRANRDALGFRLTEFVVWDRIRTAHRLGIEARPGVGPKVWLGRGSSCRLSSMGYTQNTPRLAKKIAGDKAESFWHMQEKDLPLPVQMVARNERAAVKAAQAIGYPVVVKPRHGNKGEGVGANLADRKAVREAYAEASKIEQAVVVEQYVPGDDYRLLVINSRFVAALKRIPARVIGDGRHTIAELMRIINRRERRDGLYLYPLEVDSEVKRLLAEQNFQLESIPEKRQTVWLRNAANVSRGGTIEDVTDLVHPDNRAAAVTAAEACLLDVAGIDFKSPDITRSWRDGYGRIIEINAGPGGDLHMQPTVGSPREVSYHMIRGDFPPHRQERLPSVLISGRYGKEAVARTCQCIWSRTGIAAGLLLKDQLVLSGRAIPVSPPIFDQIAVLERQPGIDAVAVMQSLESLINEGLCAQRVTCAVLTDASINEKLIDASHDPAIASRVYRLAADMATHGVVIDGRSAILTKAVEHLPPANIVMIWPKPYLTMPAPLMEHLDRGGRALAVSQKDREADCQLCWFEQHTSTCIGSIPAARESAIKSMLMAIAAVLVSTTSLERLHPVLSGLEELARTTAQNSLITDTCPTGKLRLACAVPDDLAALNTFCTLSGRTGRLWLVASSRPGMTDEWQNWHHKLADRHVYYMLEGDQELQEGLSPACYFNTLDSAWQSALDCAADEDTVLLLATDDRLRKQIFDTRPRLPACPQWRDTSSLWPAATLAEMFQGTWVNGRDCNWGIDRIGWGSGMVGPDMLTILPGYPDQKGVVPKMEARLEAVMAAGAAAAVSPVISGSLPRWKPVLQTDDPLGGILRLGEYARQRLPGSVIALQTDAESMKARLEELGNVVSTTLKGSVHVGQAYNDPSITGPISGALALANAGPEHSIYIFPWQSPDPLTGRMLRPDLVVLDATSSLLTAVKDYPASLHDEAIIFALISPGEQEHWHSLANGSDHTVNLVVETKETGQPTGWERLISALLSYCAHK